MDFSESKKILPISVPDPTVTEWWDRMFWCTTSRVRTPGVVDEIFSRG